MPKRTAEVGPIVKAATNFMAQMPGGEKLVLQAVKDMLDELRDLRRLNRRLEKENETLHARIDRMKMARAAR